MTEAEATERLRETGAAILAGVERAVPTWVEREVQRIVDAWGRLDPAAAEQVGHAAVRAGRAAAQRVGGELRALTARDAAQQAVTPLQIVRSVYREPTAVLTAAGIPAVERDAFHETAWPDDHYGLVPEHLSDLGDEDLGPLLLAWGMAKAGVLRSRAAPPAAEHLM